MGTSKNWDYIIYVYDKKTGEEKYYATYKNLTKALVKSDELTTKNKVYRVYDKNYELIHPEPKSFCLLSVLKRLFKR